MLRIRLRRVGKKKQPMYRIVVADSRSPRDGSFIEVLGHYQPLTNPSTIVLDSERARHWLDRGAQPSERVWKILAIEGVAEVPAKLKTRIELGKQRAAEAKKAKPKAEAAAEVAPAAEEAPEAAAEAEAPAAKAEEASEEPAAAEAEEAPQAEAPAEAEKPAETEAAAEEEKTEP